MPTRMVETKSNAVYNLACMYALQGRREEALSFLEQSIQYGLLVRIGLKISEDEDSKSLHGNPRFEALAAEAKGKCCKHETGIKDSGCHV
jgi:hypothetical protein